MKYVRKANMYLVTEKGVQTKDSKGRFKTGQKQTWFDTKKTALDYEKSLKI